MLMIYLFFALRQVYQSGMIAAGIKSILLTAGTIAGFWLYRLALFLITFHTV